MKRDLQPQQEGEKMMNEQERELDLQLGDALAQIESYRLTRLQDGVTIAGLLLERDEYQVAADKLAMECKVLRDACDKFSEDEMLLTLRAEPAQDCHATGVCVRSGLYVAAQPEQEDDLMIAYLSGVHDGKKEAKAQQVKPWVGLTDDERAGCWRSSAQQSAINIEAKLKERNK